MTILPKTYRFVLAEAPEEVFGPVVCGDGRTRHRLDLRLAVWLLMSRHQDDLMPPGAISHPVGGLDRELEGYNTDPVFFDHRPDAPTAAAIEDAVKRIFRAILEDSEDVVWYEPIPEVVRAEEDLWQLRQRPPYRGFAPGFHRDRQDREEVQS